MKRKLPALLLGLVFLVGAGVFLYPTVADWFARRNASHIVDGYEAEVGGMQDEALLAQRQQAEEYNMAVAGGLLADPFTADGAPAKEYLSILNIDGAIGYIEIPAIDLRLPIYHTTSEEVLQQGVGHVEGTAFPIGGDGNHTVLTGHSGLANARFFTDLEKLQEGDTFLITVLNETLAYAVDEILVVLPHEADALRPVPSEDYVTLLTCTPYGINSHRLLVRGTRTALHTGSDDLAGKASSFDPRLWVALAFALLWLGILLFFRAKKRRQGKNHEAP